MKIYKHIKNKNGKKKQALTLDKKIYETRNSFRRNETLQLNGWNEQKSVYDINLFSVVVLIFALGSLVNVYTGIAYSALALKILSITAE